MSTTISRQTLASRVASRLKDEILMGSLKPGERLNEIAIAERFGVSPTPVREAMRVLCNEGVVEYADRKGMRVIDITEREIRQAFAVRNAIERLALSEAMPLMSTSDREQLVDLAAQTEDARGQQASFLFEIDRRFHAFLVDASENVWLSDFSGRIANVLTVARLELFQYPEIDAVVAEHKAIAAAVLADDLREADKQLDKHITRVCRNAIAAHKRSRSGAADAGKELP